MAKFLTFVFALSPFFLKAQLGQTLDKIIILNNNIYQYTEARHKKNLFKLVEVSPTSIDTLFPYYLPSAGFEKNPICWDILDRKLISFPLTTDNHQQTNAMLFFYEVDSLAYIFKNYDSKTSTYLHNRSRSLSSVVPPFDIYNHRIYYRSDTLRGSLLIDFACNKDSFLFYIYIENKKILEKWHYTPFSRALGYVIEKDKVRQKAWVKLSEYNIDLSGPFRTFSANNKNYLLTEDGRVMLISDDSIKEKGQIPGLKQKILVFDKDKNRLLTIEKSLLSSTKQLLSIEKIYQNSKIIIDFNK